MAVQVDTIGIVFVPCRRPLPRDSRLQRSHRPAREQFVDEPRQLVEVKLNPTALKRHAAAPNCSICSGHNSSLFRTTSASSTARTPTIGIATDAPARSSPRTQ